MSGALFWIRAAIMLATFLYASYQDLKYREIDDWLWLLAGSLTAPIMIYDYAAARGGVMLPLVSLSIIIVWTLAYVFYKAGLYGGADAKALMTLSLALPLSNVGERLHPFLGISTLLNALIITLVIPISMFSINLYRIFVRKENLFEGLRHEPLHRRIMALFLGTRISRLDQHKFWGPMETLAKNGTRRFDFSISIDGLTTISRLENCWATPGLPLLVFLTTGLFLDLVFGDLSTSLLARLLLP